MYMGGDLWILWQVMASQFSSQHDRFQPGNHRFDHHFLTRPVGQSVHFRPKALPPSGPGFPAGFGVVTFGSPGASAVLLRLPGTRGR